MRLGDTENDVSRMQIKRRGDEIRVEMRDEFRAAKSENRINSGNSIMPVISANISRRLCRHRDLKTLVIFT